MTGIMVSKRDGTARAPDGKLYRVVRGKTLADVRHPLVVANPGDWQPMRIELSVDDEGAGDLQRGNDLDELRNELAEVEELAEHRGAELVRLRDGLDQRGLIPADTDRGVQGWLVNLVLEALDERPGEPPVAAAVTKPAVVPPKLARKRAAGRTGDDG